MKRVDVLFVEARKQPNNATVYNEVRMTSIDNVITTRMTGINAITRVLAAEITAKLKFYENEQYPS